MDRVFATTKWLAEHRLSVLGFAVAAAYWPTFLQGAFAPRWIVIAVGLPLVSNLDPRNLPEGIRWLLVWMLSLAVISTTFASPDPLTGYYELIFVVLLCLAFIAGAGLDSLDEVMIGMGIGLAVSSLLILGNLSEESGRSVRDLTGLFFNTEVLAEFAALIFVWSIARGRFEITGIAAVPLLFCGSRIAILVAMAGTLYAYQPKSKLLFAAMIAGVSLAAIGMIFAFGVGKMGSADHRLTLWLATIFAWTQFGHGLGWFLTKYPLEQFAHSDALQMVAELGIGAVAMIAIPITIFRNSGGNRAERATFIGVCIQVVMSFPLHLPASGFVAAIVAGRLVGAGYRLRLGERHGRVEDGGSVQRPAAAVAGYSAQGGRIGTAFPAGPVLAAGPALCSGENWHHSSKAR